VARLLGNIDEVMLVLQVADMDLDESSRQMLNTYFQCYFPEMTTEVVRKLKLKSSAQESRKSTIELELAGGLKPDEKPDARKIQMETVRYEEDEMKA
jgi:hypothetical protein